MGNGASGLAEKAPERAKSTLGQREPCEHAERHTARSPVATPGAPPPEQDRFVTEWSYGDDDAA